MYRLLCVTARLADNKNFRPFMSDFRLDNPRSAKGTFILMPSVRGSFSELYQFAIIFNDLGYFV